MSWGGEDRVIGRVVGCGGGGHSTYININVFIVVGVLSSSWTSGRRLRG